MTPPSPTGHPESLEQSFFGLDEDALVEQVSLRIVDVVRVEIQRYAFETISLLKEKTTRSV